MERKGQQQGAIDGKKYKSSHTAECQLDQPHPYKRETRERTIHVISFQLMMHSYKHRR